MKKHSLALTAGVLTALAGLTPTIASATGVCYAFVPAGYAEASFDGGPPLVLRYIATSVGAINTDTEAKQLGHLKQVAYGLNGKATVLFDDRCATNGPADCDQTTDDLRQIRLMTTIDGTIITGKVLTGTKPADAPGAHMGINVQFLRRIPHLEEFAVGPLTLECTSPQTSTAPASTGRTARAARGTAWRRRHPARRGCFGVLIRPTPTAARPTWRRAPGGRPGGARLPGWRVT